MRIATVLVLAGLLGACSAAPPFAILEGAFVVGTDKTMEDHIISYTSGKNCSSVRKERGQTYCEEDEVTVNPNVYCYRTLAEVTCYDRPDPHRGRHLQVGPNDHNLPR